MRRFTLLTVVLASAVTFLIGLIVAGGVHARPRRVVGAAPRTRGRRRWRSLAGRGRSPAAVNFADVAERINAAVVNIDATSKTSRERRRGEELEPGPRLRGSAAGIGQRIPHRPRRLHPHEPSRDRRRRAHHGDDGGRAGVPRRGRGRGSGDRRRAAAGPGRRPPARSRRWGTPTTCASANGSARLAIRSATSTRSRSAWSASSAASCSTRASTTTSRPTRRSISATAAGR